MINVVMMVIKSLFGSLLVCFYIQMSSLFLVTTKLETKGDSDFCEWQSLQNFFAHPKPNLYIVAIGITEYRDTTYNLKYAAKDSEDLIKAFSESKMFNRTHSFIFKNSEAVRDSILKVKRELLKTDVDDYVIISFSGHGMLDDSLDFYFCTYDIDIKHPMNSGIRFEEMENLFDSIPARQRLFLIDACHSGEVDKDAVNAEAKKAFGDNKDRIGGKVIIGESKNFEPDGGATASNQVAFEFMKELFVDLRRGTGATTISSSSGLNLSYEEDEWKNGLYTYVLLKALRDKTNSDLDRDNLLRVSELLRYVIDSVSNLSKGYQVPTSRQENIENDFVIWEFHGNKK